MGAHDGHRACKLMGVSTACSMLAHSGGKPLLAKCMTYFPQDPQQCLEPGIIEVILNSEHQHLGLAMLRTPKPSWSVEYILWQGLHPGTKLTFEPCPTLSACFHTRLSPHLCGRVRFTLSSPQVDNTGQGSCSTSWDRNTEWLSCEFLTAEHGASIWIQLKVDSEEPCKRMLN